VLIERAGISRCRELIRGPVRGDDRRMLVAAVLYVGYSIVTGLIVSAWGLGDRGRADHVGPAGRE